MLHLWPTGPPPEGPLEIRGKKWEWAPAAERASPKQVGSREGKGKNTSGGPRHVSNKSPKMKRAPYLNPDAFRRFIGPKNLGKGLVDDELVTCLLDNGAQLNFITPAYAQEQGMDIMSLDYLAKRLVEPSHTSAA